MPPLSFIADRRDHNQTLAAALKARYGLSWSKAKATIERRHVRVSGQIVADAAFRLKNGKRVTIAVGAIESPEEKRNAERGVRNKTKTESPTKKPAVPKAKATPKPESTFHIPQSAIVYSDNDIVVLDKPAGLTTMRHKDEAAEFGEGKRFLPKTAADLLPALLGTPNQKLTAVHRIDRDTSGLVVFARTAAAAKALTQQFRKHTVERRYYALVRGTPTTGRIESLLVEDRGDGRRGSGPDGTKAVTRVKVQEQYDGHALVECRLETGRTHQVRIHLGEAGTPLCGERVYDRPLNGQPHPDTSGAKRFMLHAASLGFTHPISGEALRWDSEPPADFRELQAKLKTAAD